MAEGVQGEASLDIRDLWASLRALAPSRFDAYCHPKDQDVVPLCRYLWNIEVAMSLMHRLSALEITFRNRVDQCLMEAYGSDWLEAGGLLNRHSREKVKETERRLRLAKKRAPVRDDLVGSLSLGFRTNLIESPYRNTIAIHIVSRLFVTSHDSALSQKSVASDFRAVRVLRNRISHHEPIAFNPRLPDIHCRMGEILQILSPESLVLANARNSFRKVYGASWPPFKNDVFRALA